MFTGLVQELAPVRSLEDADGGKRLALHSAELSRACAQGDSIAINGVCLTVAQISPEALYFDIVPETLGRSNLGGLRAGDLVNVETSLLAGAPLGGHFVYGHVDATSALLSRAPEGQGLRLWCATPAALEPMIVEKGYLAVDGISLTVAEVRPGAFALALVPETIKRTTLGWKVEGDLLNVEADPLARYVAAALGRIG
ncbi:MAG: riboflavin synthase [Candidatus Eremiobacteraeota bacterium]|nr:riboflavin synthase [Candidatus Eremiobacteraeota bacterium]